MKRFALNKKINFKSTFIRLLLSYIMFTSAILFVTTLAIYSGYKRQIIENSISSSQKILEQASYYTNYTLNWSKIFSYQLYLNQDIYNLMYLNKNGNITEIANPKIMQLTSSIPSIYSIYIYNNNNEKIYTSVSGEQKADSFYDREIIDILKNSSETFTSSLIPRRINLSSEYNSNYKKNVLSIFLSNSKNPKNNLPDGAIIINLDADEVEKYFKTISENGCDLFAIDNKGNIVLHSSSGMFLKNISQSDYVKKILESKNLSGNLLSDIDGKPCVITYTTLERMGLKFITITPYNTFLGSINKMIHLIIVIFITIFIIGAACSYLMSVRIYSPIDRIVKQIKSKAPINNDLQNYNKSNEFDFLSLAIDNILNEKLSLKKLSIEDTNFIKKQLLKSILLNTVVNFKDIKTKFEELNINISENGNIVIVFKIDRIKHFYSRFSNKDRQLIRFGICNICSDVSAKYYNNECLNINGNLISLILSTSKEPGLEGLDLIINIVAEIQNYVLSYFSVSLSSGIGSYAYNLSQISSSYKLAIDCVNYRLKYGTNSILYSDKINSDINNDYFYDENLENSLFNAIKLGNMKNIETELDKMLNKISTYSYSNILLSISQLALHSKKLADTLYKVNNETRNISLKNFLDNLDKLETLNEVKAWFMNLYSNCVTQFNEKKLNRVNTIVKAVTNYIEENYPNPSLSPEGIADHVNISSNYLRTIFKNTVNKSLSIYISEIRFNKAKILLETTDLTVSEISTAVGFSNTNYFYTAFKKNYGISPNHYRNTYKSI